MNPDLKVPAKRISSISKQTNVSSFEQDLVFDEIDLYIDMCEKDVRNEGEPKKHHRIPEFLLRSFETDVAGKKLIQAIRYQISQDDDVSIKPLANKNANSFSVVPNFYSIDELHEEYEATLSFGGNDKYRIEKFLAVIESNASSIIKLRQKANFYKSNTFDNPYLYPENIAEELRRHRSSSMLDTTTGQRVVLAVFFAAQYLRSFSMYNHFTQRKELIKHEAPPSYGYFRGESFPDWIRYMLPIVAKLFYSRAWRWVYSSHDGFMLDGTAIVPLFLPESPVSPAMEHSFVMPLGRNSMIYFLELNTFWNNHDGVFRSYSLGTSNWTIQKLLLNLPYNFSSVKQSKTKIRETIICMHPETTLAHLFKTNQVENFKLKKEIEYLAKNNIVRLKELNFLGDIERI